MLEKGLTQSEVVERQKIYGPNEIKLEDSFSVVSLFFSQFKNPLIYILLLVSVISLFFEEYINAVLVSLVILVNAIMGFFQEYHVQKTLAVLKKILKPVALVIRDGKHQEIDVKDLVPEDLVVLGEGDRVPADGRLVKSAGILINEALLTGEVEAVAKSEISQEEGSVFMGTMVVAGSGLMRVEKIGMETEMGKIGKSLSEIKDDKTPLQIKLEDFTKKLLYITCGVTGLLFVVGLFYGESFWVMLETAIVLSIAAVPEGLPIAVTVILALGMRRILKKNGLVKQLLAVETLGSTSVICTDKTGTLTEGNMRVVKAESGNQKDFWSSLILANNRKDSLEVALWEYVKEQSGVDPQVEFDFSPRIAEDPFDSDKKYMATINKVNGGKAVFIKGAPEIVLSFCEVEDSERRVILKNLEDWASEGLKVLGVASKLGGDFSNKSGFQWLGLVGIIDPIRKEAKEAIAVAMSAGIQVKIVTGDYRKTAERVAMNLGFAVTESNVLEGKELETWDAETLKNKISEIILFTRVTPKQKQIIVKALQDRGEIVAMTGDGVNDAPALKEADIGVVVGSATEVAKESADLVLLDNNFQTIVSACEEGRLIFSNIKKTVGYMLSNAFSGIILVAGAVVLGFPAPLSIIQILWINLINNGPSDLFLAFEPKEKDLMKKKPQDIKREPVLDKTLQLLVLLISSVIGFLALWLFFFFGISQNNLDLGRTMAFATLAVTDLFYIFAYKDLHHLIIQTEDFFHNKFLFLGVAYGLILLLAAIYLPMFNRILGTVPLHWQHWVYIVGVAIAVTVFVELIKFLSWRFRKN